MGIFRVDLVSAEAEIFSGKAQYVSMPGAQGDFGVLTGHAPFLTTLRPGTVHIRQASGEEIFFYIAGGFAEVQASVVTVMADTVMRADDLDESKAELARQAAAEALQNQTSRIEYAKAQAELMEAAAQLAAISRFRKRKSASS
ncbi:MAG: F0F1 ATP synthase subunit epsilon [Burkholderiales bacterium]|nr:F0F1 ATP synthase subunit epsilon [Burkholderiales bacterium]